MTKISQWAGLWPFCGSSRGILGDQQDSSPAAHDVLKSANWPASKSFSMGRPGGGMLIAPWIEMPVAEKLIEEIEDFALRNPGHQGSVDALLGAVRRIEAEFAGETREALLSQARETFLQQIRILETAERTRETLATLQTNQKALVDALKKLTGRPPEDVTLH